MTHASLFSGIGGAELAARWVGWKNVFHCEINPFGRRVIEYHFPESKSYEDVTTTDFSEYRGRIDVLTAGFPCFVAGTPVLTRRGFLSIEEVEVGDEVLTTDRTYHSVECTMRHKADKIVRMKAQGMYKELKCTPNHPFYIRRRQTYYEKGVGKIRHLAPEYIKASDVREGDKVGFPIFEGEDRSYSKAFWKLIGTWLADGWVQDSLRKGRKNSHEHKVIICCGKKNIARLHHIIQAAGYKYTLSEGKSTFKCIICDKWLCSFLKDFGKYAHGKHLSPQCFMLDHERKKSLLEGWFADGYRKPNGAQCVTTVSEQLALGMSQISRDVFKCPVSISKKTCNRVCTIEGREVNERPQYCVTISNSDRYGFYEDGFVWCNVKSIREESEINEVYNLSVNEEHSYNVYGIAVHNCQPFSVAGQRKGAEDNRYLWPEVVRVIREVRPTWVVGENVAGILTMVQPGEETEMGGQTNIFGEVDRKRVLLRQEYVVETICGDLEREGYSIQPFIIPACAVGAPHRRDRVWIVARRTQDDNNVLRGENTCGFGGFSVFESMEVEDKPLRLRLSDNKVKGRWQEMEIYLNAQIDLLSERERRSRPYQQEQTGQQEAKPADCSSLGELSQQGKGNRREETERTKQMVCADLCERGKEIPWMLRHERRSDGCKDSCGTPPVAHCTDRWNIVPSEREESSLHERESIAKSYTNRPSSYTDGNRHSSRESSKENERRREDISSTTRKGGSGSKRSNGLFGFSQYVTNSNNNRLQGNIFSRNNEKDRWEVKDRYVKKSSYNSWLSIPADRWKDFPTQSPVCSGDDELSTRLDGITFSKWRQESIKAYGNAMCPQVVYEIFKAIEIINKNVNLERYT